MEFINNISAFLSINNSLFIFLVVYFLGIIFSRFLPDYLSFLLAGLILRPFIPEQIFTFGSKFFIPYFIYFLLFYTGLSFPWQQVNLIRKRLYKFWLSSYLSIFASITGLFFLFKYLSKFSWASIIKDNFNVLPYLLLIILFPAYQEIRNLIKKINSKGPLSTFSENSSLLFSITGLLILTIAFLDPSGLLIILFKLGILVIMISLFKLLCPQKQLFLFLNIGILAVFFQNNFLNLLLPLFTGLIFSFFWKNKEEFTPGNYLSYFSNAALIFALPLITINKTILLLGILFFLIKQVVYRLFLFIWGKPFSSESVYKNISNLLINQDLLPLYIFYGMQFNTLSSIDFSLLFSVFILLKLLEQLFWLFLAPKSLRKAGEAN